MAAVAVLPPVKLPGESMQIDQASTTETDEDLYTRLKTLQRQLEFLDIQARRAWLLVLPCSMNCHFSHDRR